MRTHLKALLLATIVQSSASAIVTGAASAQTNTVAREMRRTVADTVAAQIERSYVDADTAKLIAARVRSRKLAGAYDTLENIAAFTSALTGDLRSVNGDLHLSVTYTPPGGPTGARAATAFADRSQHYALGRLDVLPGNVGYMEVTGFSAEAAAPDVIVAALRYLESTDAIIIDIRRNRGGTGALSNFLLSHFTGADTVPSLVIRSRNGAPFTRYTLPSVPGPRRTNVPLYLLTSRGSASAAEDFAFVLKNLKRATLVGDRTAGAGHNVTFVSAGFGFQTGISITRVSDARTGKEWERVGVQPDIPVSPGTSLDVAYAAALKQLQASVTDASQRHALDLLVESANARVTPPQIAPARLASYAGTYEGNRQVSIVDGNLYYSVNGGLAEKADAITESVFALSSQARLSFDTDETGRRRLRIQPPVGPVATYLVLQK